MFTDYSSQVLALAAPTKPVEQPRAQDWIAVETKLGLTLPEDYKAMVTALGTGTFGIALSLRNPCASSEYVRLSREALAEYQEVTEDSAKLANISLFPQADGLLPIATAERQILLLQFNPQKQPTQLIYWDYDYDTTQPLSISLSQFIFDLYHRRISEPWAEDFRNFVWRDTQTPFYTCWSVPSNV